MKRLTELAIAIPLAVTITFALCAWARVMDARGNGNDAREALNSVLDRCPPGNARYQASTTNEAGAVWFTLRCERGEASNNLKEKAQ